MTAELPAAIGLTGIATGAAVGLLTAALGPPPADPITAARRAGQRASSIVFRWFEPLVLALAGHYRDRQTKRMAKLTKAISILDLRPWAADELAGTKAVEAFPLAVLLGLIGDNLFGWQGGVGLALAGLAGGPRFLIGGVIGKADRHIQRVRGRLPYTLDLMALMLEAGAGTLNDCLHRAAAENAGHPLGRELDRVLAGIDQGAPPASALAEFADRLDDPDVSELVLALNTAEERGIPLRDALRSQADRMRLRLVQWMEKSAEQAKVHITWPAMVVMLACLIVIAAPLLLSVVAGPNE